MASAINSQPHIYIYNSNAVAPKKPCREKYFATYPACFEGVLTALKECGVPEDTIGIARNSEDLIKAEKLSKEPLAIIFPGGDYESLEHNLFGESWYLTKEQEETQFMQLLKRSNILGICAGGNLVARINNIFLASHPYFAIGRPQNHDTDGKAVVVNVVNSEAFPTVGKISQFLTYWNSGLSFRVEDDRSTTSYVFYEKARNQRQGEVASFALQRARYMHIGISFHPEIRLSNGYNPEQIPLGMSERENNLVNQAILMDLFSQANIHGDPAIREKLALELRSIQLTKALLQSLPVVPL